ncbi:TPA: hypothetical protein L5U90_003349 [Pseudomonas aeruginosa]|nr:hypothetical protein [Pseudomonas aeruginosa]
MKVTAADYAKAKGISIGTARKRLNEMVEYGNAHVDYGVIIEQRSVKKGSRSQTMAIRGNLYHLKQQADTQKPDAPQTSPATAGPRADFLALVRRIKPKHSASFSKNLWLWMMKHGRQGDTVFQVGVGSRLALLYGAGTLFIGQPYNGYEGDTDFSGAPVMQVLCMGSSVVRACYAGAIPSLIEVAGFWARYEQVGRCAIDPNHRVLFQEFDRRYELVSGQRTCKWCSEAVPESV